MVHPVLIFFSLIRLLTQAKSLDKSTIAGNVFVVEILQQLAATTYELGERTSGSKVLVVLLQVLGEVLDAEGEQGYLALARTCVGSRLAILAENLLLLSFVEIHNLMIVIKELIAHNIFPTLHLLITAGLHVVRCSGLSEKRLQSYCFLARYEK